MGTIEDELAGVFHVADRQRLGSSGTEISGSAARAIDAVVEAAVGHSVKGVDVVKSLLRDVVCWVYYRKSVANADHPDMEWDDAKYIRSYRKRKPDIVGLTLEAGPDARYIISLTATHRNGDKKDNRRWSTMFMLQIPSQCSAVHPRHKEDAVLFGWNDKHGRFKVIDWCQFRAHQETQLKKRGYWPLGQLWCAEFERFV